MRATCIGAYTAIYNVYIDYFIQQSIHENIHHIKYTVHTCSLNQAFKYRSYVIFSVYMQPSHTILILGVLFTHRLILCPLNCM